jgi:hypothetical protein
MSELKTASSDQFPRLAMSHTGPLPNGVNLWGLCGTGTLACAPAVGAGLPESCSRNAAARRRGHTGKSACAT